MSGLNVKASKYLKWEYKSEIKAYKIPKEFERFCSLATGRDWWIGGDWWIAERNLRFCSSYDWAMLIVILLTELGYNVIVSADCVVVEDSEGSCLFEESTLSYPNAGQVLRVCIKVLESK